MMLFMGRKTTEIHRPIYTPLRILFQLNISVKQIREVFDDNFIIIAPL